MFSMIFTKEETIYSLLVMYLFIINFIRGMLFDSENYLKLRPNYEVAELTWQNGQLAMNGLSSGGLLPTGPTKPTWNRAGDTLESVVHQATWPNQNLYPPLPKRDHNPANVSSAVGSTIVKRAETLGRMHVGPKRVRSETDQCGGSFGSSIQEERSACAAAASATFCKENDATMVTWASFESPRNLKTKTTDEDSAGDLDGSVNMAYVSVYWIMKHDEKENCHDHKML